MGRRHPNVLKAAKQRREGRRAWFKDYGGSIHVPRSVGKSDVPDDAQALFNYRDRGNSYYDPFLNAIFPGVTPKESDWSAEDVEKKFLNRDGTAIPTNVGERNGRRWALSRADEERLATRLEQEDFCEYVTLSDCKKQRKRLTYIFNRKKTRFFFVEVWYDEGASFIRISKEYGERDRAIFDFGHFNPGFIRWVETLPLTSLELVLPTRRSSSD